MEHIPFNNLKYQDSKIRKELELTFQQVLEEGQFIGGARVTEFENQFSEYTGTENVIPCGNGSDAMELILRGLDIGLGDEIILPANGHFSTYEAIVHVGAKAIMVDIDPLLQIDPEAVEPKISSKTKAIVAVHMHGNLADLTALQQLTKKHDLYLIEDCAQAAGAIYLYRQAGTIGDAAAFSFYPTKNLGAYGDAGAITTNKSDLAKICRLMANHGEISKNKHILVGSNSRMDSMQAAFLSVKLKYLTEWNDQRIQIAKIYDQLLSDLPVQKPKPRADCKHVYHLYVIQVDRRDQIISEFMHQQIGYSIHYPEIIPATTAVKPLGYDPKDYPRAFKASNEMISLPLFLGITRSQQEKVAEAIKVCYG